MNRKASNTDRMRKVAAYRARRLQLITQMAYVAQLPESDDVRDQVASMQRELHMLAARHAVSMATHLRPGRRRGELATRALDNLEKLRRCRA